MIPVWRNEISTRLAETYFTIRLHEKIKLRLDKAGQFSTWYLFGFVYIFFMKFYKCILTFFLTD